jgi:CheY-specific phosphatase CheX
MLMEQFAAVDHQVIDGVGELTNMVAGGIKKWLLGTPWAFSDVTVPSVIVGQNYDIAFAQGFRFLALTFEHAQCKSIMVQDRLLCAAVSLFRV